MKLAGN